MELPGAGFQRQLEQPRLPTGKAFGAQFLQWPGSAALPGKAAGHRASRGDGTSRPGVGLPGTGAE